MQKFSVTVGASTIKVEPDPVGSFTPTILANSNITGVNGVFNQKPLTAQPGEWAYKYNTMTILEIHIDDGRVERLELQEVSNQPTWNLGTQAALNQAVADIQAVL